MDIKNILKKEESRRLEFKEQYPVKANLLKTIIAFANGSGGKIIIGVEDKTKKILGLKEDPLFLEGKIVNLIYDSVSPVIIPFISLINIEKKLLLVIEISAGNQKPYFLKAIGLKNGTFIRISSTNRKADSLMIQELKRQSMNISFDSQVDYQLISTDLSLNLLDIYLKIKKSSLKTSFESFEQIGICIRTNNFSHPTFAGILIFAENYANFFIKITKFINATRTEVENISEFFPPLQNQLEMSYNRCMKVIPSKIRINGLVRETIPAIPSEVIRKALVNAICYRDYFINGSEIQVHIFTDRIEIINPGTLPGNLTIEDLGKGISEIRNKQVVKFFREFGYIDQLGSGISRMIEICAENDIRRPLFEEHGNFFKVILFFSLLEIDRILLFIQKQKIVSIAQLVDKFKLHRNTIRSRLANLLENNIIIREGKGPNTRFKIK
ncbi:MAG: putative DNA binding domain-containing protein [Candidatus Cloacimonetes bacterium]|nr:putative DNA binding domain-containing protein [Candidatus Cloacimonadota bacterium]